MRFFESGSKALVRSLLTHDTPLYVQYYVTARCNLRCQQCNIIYANGDQEECSTTEASVIAENLAAIGTSVVLLTGGEPFTRQDLPEIVGAFVENGVHPRLQTNGYASSSALRDVVDRGAKDISISLDSLRPSLQDSLNGGFEQSWDRAIDRIAMVSQIFPKDSFCALGCVLSPHNLDQILPIIKFATEIGWWVSLVPAHQSPPHRPRSFASYDPRLVFKESQYAQVADVIESAKALRDSGHNLYDSDEYLDDILRYVTKDPIRWRRRNNGLCDSPNLYFAVQPNGTMSVCCDFRLKSGYKVYDSIFPDQYRRKVMHNEAQTITRSCDGCMYGSFPEITISARYLRPMFSRSLMFLQLSKKNGLVSKSSEQLKDIAAKILVG